MLIGKDGWLFLVWGSLIDVDVLVIVCNIVLIVDVKCVLDVVGVKLEVLVLLDKVLFYEDRLFDGKWLGDVVWGCYVLVYDGLEKVGVLVVDVL